MKFRGRRFLKAGDLQQMGWLEAKTQAQALCIGVSTSAVLPFLPHCNLFHHALFLLLELLLHSISRGFNNSIPPPLIPVGSLRVIFHDLARRNN